MKVSELTFDECRGFLLERPNPSKQYFRSVSLSIFSQWKSEVINTIGDIDVVIEQPTKNHAFQVVFKDSTGMRDDNQNEIFIGDYVGKESIPKMRWMVKHGKFGIVCESQRYVPTQGWQKTPNGDHSPELMQILSEGNIKLFNKTDEQ